MRVIVCAGGTGGHIYPALAIINKIKEKSPTSKILYIGTTDRMEKDIVPEAGIDFYGIEMSGIDRKHIFKNISLIRKYSKAVASAKKIIKEFNPDIVIGVGGYITVPVLYAAHRLKCKILIHEQNAVLGISNKFLANIADTICVSLPDSLKNLPKEKTIYTGNPRSEEITVVKPGNKKDYGLSKDKKLVVIVMGSLGSTTMTEKLITMIPKFKNSDYEVLLITGKKYYDDYKNIEVPSNVKIKPFMNELISLLKVSDLIISRAGASTLAEITAIGLPAILVPSPYVTNNHQYKNAKEIENAGACKLVEEKDFNDDVIIPMISDVLDNNKEYNRMCTNMKKLGIVDSATKIYDEIRKLVKDD